jgi:hypothetical protein
LGWLFGDMYNKNYITNVLLHGIDWTIGGSWHVFELRYWLVYRNFFLPQLKTGPFFLFFFWPLLFQMLLSNCFFDRA